MHILKTVSGETIKLSPKDYQQYLRIPKGGRIHLHDANVDIAEHNISLVYEECNSDLIEDRKKQQIGILHDGRMVKRHFGQWVLADVDFTPNDNGDIKPVIPDPTYYPEIVKDCVPTPQEFETKYAHLPIAERKQLFLNSPGKSTTVSELQSVSAIIQNKTKQLN